MKFPTQSKPETKPKPAPAVAKAQVRSANAPAKAAVKTPAKEATRQAAKQAAKEKAAKPAADPNAFLKNPVRWLKRLFRRPVRLRRQGLDFKLVLDDPATRFGDSVLAPKMSPSPALPLGRRR